MLKSHHVLLFILTALVCGSLNAEIIEIGFFNTPGDANDIIIVGEFAFVADNQSGLRIIDISNPEEPEEIGFLDTPGSALSVAVRGDIALIGDGPRGLKVIDINNPEQPEEIGSFVDECIVNGVAISGDIVYLSDAISGFRVIDLRDPENPVQIAELETPDVAQDVFVSGDFAYVADTQSGMYIIDISDPENPEEVGVYDSPGEAMSIVVVGNYAYIADEIAGLQIVSIRNPARPFRHGRFDTPGFAYGVKISGNYAFIADGSEGLQIVNISDPRDPDRIVRFNTPGTCYEVAVSDGLIYLADGESGMRIISLTPSIEISDEELNFEAVILNNSISRTLTITNEGHTDLIIRDIVVEGDDFSTDFEDEIVIAANSNHGIRVTFTPEIIRMREGSLTIISNAPNQEEILIPLFGAGLGEIQQIAYAHPGGVTYDVEVKGNLAFVIAGVNGLHVFDMSDPERPVEIGSVGTPDCAMSICIREDFAYVAVDQAGTSIIDISNPENPRAVGRRNSGGRIWDVALTDNQDIIVEYGDILRIIDVSDPEHPQLAGSLDPGHGNGITVQENIAYLASTGNLRIVDISNPQEPIEIGSCNLSYPKKVTVNGDFAYVANRDRGNLQIVDIGDPENPERVDIGDYDPPGLAYGIEYKDGFVFLANRDAGICVIDVTNPENPIEVGSFDTRGSAWGITVSGDLAFVADIQGLCILDVSAFLDAVPVISLDPERFNFGRIPIGEITERTLTINNLGRAILSIANIDVEGDCFNTDFEDELLIDPGESSDIQVVFTPEEARDFVGTLTIISNDPENEELTVELTGASIDELRVPFEPGWNMVSINIIPPEEYYRRGENRGPDVVLMLDQLRIDDDLHRVLLMKNESGRFYAPGFGFNNIPYWNLTEGYQVKMEEGAEAIYSGVRIPADTDIQLEEGWNIIAYYPPFELDSGAPDFYVLSPIIENVIIAKDNYGRFMSPDWEFSNMPPWRETQGYQVRVDAEVVLNYPPIQEQIRGVGCPQENRGLSCPQEFSGVRCPHLTHNTPPYPPLETRGGDQSQSLLRRGGNTGENMSVLVTLVSGIETKAGDQIGAFSSDGLLVGVGTIDSDGRCGLAVWGDETQTEEMEGLQKGEAFNLKLLKVEKEIGTDLVIESILTGQNLTYSADSFIVVIVSTDVTVPKEFFLSSVYPNPFNSTTRITFGLPVASQVSIKLFDQTGCEIKTLVKGNARAGVHTSILNATDLPSGLYLIHLKTAEYVFTRKVILIR